MAAVMKSISCASDEDANEIQSKATPRSGSSENGGWIMYVVSSGLIHARSCETKSLDSSLKVPIFFPEDPNKGPLPTGW